MINLIFLTLKNKLFKKYVDIIEINQSYLYTISIKKSTIEITKNPGRVYL